MSNSQSADSDRKIRTVIEAGEFDSGIEHLQRLDRLDRGYQEAFARLIKRQQATAQAGSADSGPQNRTDDSAPESSHPTKDEAVTAEIREFGRYLDEEVGSRLVEADPEDRPEIVQNALKGVTELRAMVREFDNTDALDSPQKHYDALDKIESQLREWERQAIKDAENSGWDLQSLVESVTRGLEAYSKAKQATAEANATSDAGTDRQPRDDTVHSTRSSQAHARQSEPEDPHTAAKSQSSSISESASRVWNTVTLQNAFSPKCPECNRKSAAPVSGEEDVYQCDNCGNIFDTHPDSRRELEFS